MKKIYLLWMSLFAIPAYGQYINPVVQPDTITQPACTAKITVEIYGAKPPYNIEWYDLDGYQKSGGFHAENICNGFLRITVMDSACRKLESCLNIYNDPARQVMVDTIIVTMPTPGNSDGSIEIQFDQYPVGYTKAFGPYYGSITGTNNTVFTGLSEDLYIFTVSDPLTGNWAYSTTIPLMQVNAPCDHFETELTHDYPSYLPGGETGCDASMSVYGYGPATGDYYCTMVYYYPSGGSNTLNSDDAYNMDYEKNVCRTLYRMYAANDESAYAYHYCFFLPDSSGTTSVWNAPGVVLPGTDTLYLQTVSNCHIDHGSPIDSVYIVSHVPLGGNQFELTFGVIQDNDTVFVYNTAIMDSATHYFFDIIVHCGINYGIPFTDHSRHLVYFEALDTRSTFFEKQPVTEDVRNKVMVYPNPFNENIRIRSDVKINKMELYTINGKMLWSLGVQDYGFTVDTGNLEPAVYLLKVYGENGQVAVSRLTKMH